MGFDKNSQRSGHFQVSPFCLNPTIHVIHQDLRGLYQERQGYCRTLAGIEGTQRSVIRRIGLNIQPGWRILDPSPNNLGGSGR